MRHRRKLIVVGLILTAVWGEFAAPGRAPGQQTRPATLPFAIPDENFIDRSIPDGIASHVKLRADGRALTVTLEGNLALRVWEASPFQLKETTFAHGSTHIWMGTGNRIFGYVLDSDPNDPLVFQVDRQKGYFYVKGAGSVTMPNGTIVRLPLPPLPLGASVSAPPHVVGPKPSPAGKVTLNVASIPSGSEVFVASLRELGIVLDDHKIKADTVRRLLGFRRLERMEDTAKAVSVADPRYSRGRREAGGDLQQAFRVHVPDRSPPGQEPALDPDLAAQGDTAPRARRSVSGSGWVQGRRDRGPDAAVRKRARGRHPTHPSTARPGRETRLSPGQGTPADHGDRPLERKPRNPPSIQGRLR